MPRGLLASILKSAGLTADEFAICYSRSIVQWATLVVPIPAVGRLMRTVRDIAVDVLELIRPSLLRI